MLIRLVYLPDPWSRTGTDLLLSSADLWCDRDEKRWVFDLFFVSQL